MKTLWKAEIDGSMISETENFRLEVRDVGGMARFLVRLQAKPGVESRKLLGSGSQPNEWSAKTAAQAMADRILLSGLCDLTAELVCIQQTN